MRTCCKHKEMPIAWVVIDLKPMAPNNNTVEKWTWAWNRNRKATAVADQSSKLANAGAPGFTFDLKLGQEEKLVKENTDHGKLWCSIKVKRFYCWCVENVQRCPLGVPKIVPKVNYKKKEHNTKRTIKYSKWLLSQCNSLE